MYNFISTLFTTIFKIIIIIDFSLCYIIMLSCSVFISVCCDLRLLSQSCFSCLLKLSMAVLAPEIFIIWSRLWVGVKLYIYHCMIGGYHFKHVDQISYLK